MSHISSSIQFNWKLHFICPFYLETFAFWLFFFIRHLTLIRVAVAVAVDISDCCNITVSHSDQMEYFQQQMNIQIFIFIFPFFFFIFSKWENNCSATKWFIWQYFAVSWRIACWCTNQKHSLSLNQSKRKMLNALYEYSMRIKWNEMKWPDDQASTASIYWIHWSKTVEMKKKMQLQMI